MPKETPLVGFHGMVDEFGINQLGLILVDTLDPVCQHPYYDEFTMPSIYIGMDDYESSMAVEESITEDEKVRAKALEAMLMYDNMVSAQKSKEEILD